MGRELCIVWAGRHRRDAWESLCRPYRERIGKFLAVRDLPVRVRSGLVGAERVREEAAALREAVPERAWVVALDRRGKRRSSRELAGWLAQLIEGRPHPIAFLIGSDLGLDGEALAAASERLSLGPLTLPHELARLVLYEQIYRALSIRAGIKYHRQPL